MTADYAGMLVRPHPLQRQPSPSRGTSALLHLLGLCSFAYSFSYLVLNPNQINDSYGWHLQYLTIIGLSLATTTFAVGLLADITLSRRLFAVKNALSVASAPMECLISILYWGLRLIDPDLVLPHWAPPISRVPDLAFHALPSIALVTDLLLFSPPYTIAFLPALGLSVCIAFGYWIWVEQCYRYNSFYPYPIFAMLSTPQRIGLFAGSALLMTLSTGVLMWMYNVVNGKEKTTQAIGMQNERSRLKEYSDNLKGQ